MLQMWEMTTLFEYFDSAVGNDFRGCQGTLHSTTYILPAPDYKSSSPQLVQALQQSERPHQIEVHHARQSCLIGIGHAGSRVRSQLAQQQLIGYAGWRVHHAFHAFSTRLPGRIVEGLQSSLQYSGQRGGELCFGVE